MDNALLLAEIEDLLRTVPRQETRGHSTAENFAWFGRLTAVMGRWDAVRTQVFLGEAIDAIQGGSATAIAVWGGYNKIMTMLHQARYDLMMKTGGPQTIAFDQGRVFHYFDTVRKIVETASTDVFFVDRYMGADFVSFYLPHVKSGVRAMRWRDGDTVPVPLAAIRVVRYQLGSDPGPRYA